MRWVDTIMMGMAEAAREPGHGLTLDEIRVVLEAAAAPPDRARGLLGSLSSLVSLRRHEQAIEGLEKGRAAYVVAGGDPIKLDDHIFELRRSLAGAAAAWQKASSLVDRESAPGS